MAHEEPGLLELGQDAVHRGESGVRALVEQQTIDFFRGQVPDLALFEQLEDAQARAVSLFQNLRFRSTGEVTRNSYQ